MNSGGTIRIRLQGGARGYRGEWEAGAEWEERNGCWLEKGGNEKSQADGPILGTELPLEEGRVG